MYLSDRDLRWAIETGRLIVSPLPAKIDTTSIDLHLDKIEEAKVWDLVAINKANKTAGLKQDEVRIGQFDYRSFSAQFLVPLQEKTDQLAFRRGHEVVIKPRGFLLWQTEEVVGTAEDRADLICFVEGKSTKARTGLLVHMTAPTIHSTWIGNITLEIANLGPFTFVLEAKDVIAQLTVATISSPPAETMKTGVTYRQATVAAQPGEIPVQQFQEPGQKKAGQS
jgi:dCTP deaminase